MLSLWLFYEITNFEIDVLIDWTDRFGLVGWMMTMDGWMDG